MMRDVIACLLGAAFCGGIGPARAQIHGIYEPTADFVGLVAACVMIVLAMAMLARGFGEKRA